MKASASAGDDAGLLRLLAGVDLDIEPRAAAGALDLARPGSAASLGRSSVSITSKKAHRLARLVGLQRADQAQLQPRRARSLQRASASCTRFSPNTRWPAASTARDARPRAAAWRPRSGDVGRVAARGARGGGDPRQDRGARGGGVEGGVQALTGRRSRSARGALAGGADAKAGARPGEGPAAAVLLHRPGAHARSRGGARAACRAAPASSTARSARRTPSRGAARLVRIGAPARACCCWRAPTRAWRRGSAPTACTCRSALAPGRAGLRRARPRWIVTAAAHSAAAIARRRRGRRGRGVRLAGVRRAPAPRPAGRSARCDSRGWCAARGLPVYRAGRRQSMRRRARLNRALRRGGLRGRSTAAAD